MLTGRQAFGGETVSDIVAAILTRNVDWQALPNVPEKIRELISSCLQKDRPAAWEILPTRGSSSRMRWSRRARRRRARLLQRGNDLHTRFGFWQPCF